MRMLMLVIAQRWSWASKRELCTNEHLLATNNLIHTIVYRFGTTTLRIARRDRQPENKSPLFLFMHYIAIVFSIPFECKREPLVCFTRCFILFYFLLLVDFISLITFVLFPSIFRMHHWMAGSLFHSTQYFRLCDGFFLLFRLTFA